MSALVTFLPLNVGGALALVCVFAAMTAMGIAARPARVIAHEIPVRPILAALVVALVIVPLVAIGLGRGLDLQDGALAGLVLMGISPGAPLALRRSHQAGADAEFALVLQVAVAVLAIPAVPLWILFLKLAFGREAGLSVLVLARQIFMAQLLPLGSGIILRRIAPDLSHRLLRPLLLASGVLMLVVVLLLVALSWESFDALPPKALAASASLSSTALLFAYLGCGPSATRRMSAGAICALRNPGIALLIASANGLPDDARVMVVAHVLVTAAVLSVFLILMRRIKAEAPLATAS
ncbi:MAG: hypothetical protein U1E62_20225 [Alsobacter sp.]